MIAALGLLTLSFVFCFPAGLSSTDCILGGDALASYFPYLLRSFRPVSSQIAGPWDPTVLTGLPESHSPYGIYYLPTILLYVLFPPAQALSLGLVFHHAWAGFGAYLLVRTCRLSRAAAWLAGIAFGFGGFMVFHRGHVPIHYSAAWLPWILWGFERFRTSGSMFWVVMTGTLMALQALGSLMQMIVMGAFAWLTFLAYYGIAGPGGHCARRRFVLGGLAACVLGAVGSLPQTLPMLEVSHWSGYGEFNPDFFNSGYLKFRFLVGLAGPWVLGGKFGATQPLGYWGLTEHGIFYGVLPLTLATLAILYLVGGQGMRREEQGSRIRKNAGSLTSSPPSCECGYPLPTRKEAGFWLILFCESLVLMLGKTLPVHYILSHVPIYQYFHMPTRHVWVMGLALAWLAAFGLDLLRRLDPTVRKRLLFRLSCTLLGLAGLYVFLIQTQPWPDRPTWSYPGFLIPAVCILLAFVILLLIARTTQANAAFQHPGVMTRFRIAILLTIPVALTFADLAMNIHDYEFSPASAEFLTNPRQFPEVVQWLNEREPENGPPRCLIRRETWPLAGRTGVTPVETSVPLGFGSAWGLSSLNYYTQSMPRSLLRILQLDFYGHADFAGLLAEERGLSAAAGRYVLARGPLDPFAPGMASQIRPHNGWVWKTDDCSPGHPSPLAASSQVAPVSARSTLVASIACDPGQSYLMEGVLPYPPSGAGKRPERITCRVVCTRRNSADTLGEMTAMDSDYLPDGVHFACAFESGTISGAYWITLVSMNGQTIAIPGVTLWHLTPDFADKTRGSDPREIVQKIRSGIDQPYPLLARLAGDICVYENPHARSLVHFVREVRPARDDLDAARQITAPGPPVRDLAYVVAPKGRSKDWTLSRPVRMSAGAADVHSERLDDLQINTSSKGEGFMVLAITRCIGWSATVDGHKVSIHAVDGPFMGIRVPAGEHEVRLIFRPILMWAGTLAAVLTFGGAWIGLILGRFLRWQKQTSRLTKALEVCGPTEPRERAA
jgi:hypothetical protein